MSRNQTHNSIVFNCIICGTCVAKESHEPGELTMCDPHVEEFVIKVNKDMLVSVVLREMKYKNGATQAKNKKVREMQRPKKVSL